MALPALKPKPEEPVEQRVSKLETNVERVLSDVSEIKTNVRRVEDKVDALGVRVANLEVRVEKGFGELKHAIAASRTWTLTVIGGAFGATIGAVAWLFKNIRP